MFFLIFSLSIQNIEFINNFSNYFIVIANLIV